MAPLWPAFGVETLICPPDILPPPVPDVMLTSPPVDDVESPAFNTTSAPVFDEEEPAIIDIPPPVFALPISIPMDVPPAAFVTIPVCKDNDPLLSSIIDSPIVNLTVPD